MNLRALEFYTHLIVREDAHTLFAFSSIDERALFRILLKVNGVGPKMAARLVTELKDKGPKNAVPVGGASVAAPKTAPVLSGDAALMRDLISALTNLGYDDALARQASASALESGESDLNALIPLALKALAP